MNTEDEKELAAWRAGPWVLKSEHDRILSMTREQLTKALAEIAEARNDNQKGKHDGR